MSYGRDLLDPQSNLTTQTYISLTNKFKNFDLNYNYFLSYYCYYRLLDIIGGDNRTLMQRLIIHLSNFFVMQREFGYPSNRPESEPSEK